MYNQNDKRWSRLRWYDSTIEAAVSDLTDAIHSRPESVIGSNGEDCTLGQSGCWHVSVASMLSHLGQEYEHALFTPKSLLIALSDEGVGTLTGYVSRPFVDPMSIITRGAVQLYGFRDFGKNGVGPKSSELKQLLDIVDGKRFCAIVNVRAHEFFGKEEHSSHYVLIYKSGPNDYVMHDPDSKTHQSLFASYKKIFQITIYQRVPT